jgi:prolyl 4-hydroxylase
MRSYVISPPASISVAVIVATVVLILCFFSDVGLGQLQQQQQQQLAPGLGASVQHQNVADRGECTILGADNALCTAADSFGRGADYIGGTLDDLEESDDNQEEDPMLEKMPGLDFKAYKRADISSFYQEPPGSLSEKTPSFDGQPGKFQNMSPERLDLVWDAGHGPPGSPICQTGPFESCGTSSFPGHVFYFLRPKTHEVVCSFRVTKGYATYYCDPFVPNDSSDPTAGVRTEPQRSLDELTENERKLYDAASFNRVFAPMYKNFTGGSDWLGQFPTQKPKHFMWRADYFGQTHHVQSDESHFVEIPNDPDLLRPLSIPEMKNSPGSPSLRLSEFRETGPLNLTLTVVSVAPRIIAIDGFLSEVEADYIVDLANNKTLQRSTTGMHGKDSHVSDVRTSRTTWISRNSSPIMNAIIRRGADVLNINEAMMRTRLPDEIPNVPFKNAINEELQIVHYSVGQQYTAHHDFGYPGARPNDSSRSINLCLYLNDVEEGGQTSFPHWRNAETSDSIKAQPRKGRAMIFYMRTPDGNLDGLSQHAAMPVIKGEKWFSNLWVWDPEKYK